MFRPIALVSLLALSSPAAAVITISSSIAGAPDPGIPNGFATVVTFDAASASGIINTISGTPGAVITAAGNISGVRAAPAGTANGGVYQSVGTGGVSSFNFAGYLQPNRVLTGFSIYWGSIDSYNFIDFINSSGTVVRTFNGTQLPQSDGNQAAAITNRRVTFLADAADRISQVRLRSTSNAFEYDTFAVTTEPVPEPATWAMLIAGFGLVGATLRRRRAALA